MTGRTRLTRLAPLLVAGVLLAGCGVRPGEAARVGSRSISQDTVADATSAQCTLTRAAAAGGSQQTQVASRASTAQSTLALLIQADQRIAYGESHDVDVDTAALRTQRASLSAQLAERGLSRAERDALLEVSDTLSRGQLVVQGVGAVPLGSSVPGAGSDQAALTRGTQIVDRWVASSGPSVSVDPRYDLGVRRGQVRLGDGSVSTPVSAVARQSVAQQPSQGFVTSLPLPQRCG